MPWTDRNRITDILNAFLNSQKKLFKISHYLITISKMWITVYNQITITSQTSNAKYPQCSFDVFLTWLSKSNHRLSGSYHHCSTNSYRWNGTPGIPFPSYVTPSCHNSSLAGGKTLRYKMPVCSPLKDRSGIWRKTDGKSQKTTEKLLKISGCDITPSVSEQAS